MIRSHTISSDLLCLVIDMNNNKIEFQPEKGQTIPLRYRHLPTKTYDFLKPDFCFFYPKNLSRSLMLPCFEFFPSLLETQTKSKAPYHRFDFEILAQFHRALTFQITILIIQTRSSDQNFKNPPSHPDPQVKA